MVPVNETDESASSTFRNAFEKMPLLPKLMLLGEIGGETSAERFEPREDPPDKLGFEPELQDATKQIQIEIEQLSIENAKNYGPENYRLVGSPLEGEESGVLSPLAAEGFVLYPFEKTDKFCSSVNEVSKKFSDIGLYSDRKWSFDYNMSTLFLPAGHFENVLMYADEARNRPVFSTALSSLALEDSIFGAETPQNSPANCRVMREAIMRRPEIGVVTNIRYEPTLSRLHAALPGLAKLSEKLFFLFKLHHAYLTYAAKCLRWRFTVSYRRLLSSLDDVLAEIDAKLPHKLQVTIYPQGTFTIIAEKTVHRDNLLSGIFSQELINPSRLTDKMLKLAELSLPHNSASQPVYQLYWDTHSSTIGYHTTFRTTYSGDFEEALNRVECHAAEGVLTDVVGYSSGYEVINGYCICIAIFRDEKWYTPSFDGGACCDPMRSMLLSSGLIREAPIHVHDLLCGEEVLVFGSEVGVLRGVFANQPPPLPPQKRLRKRKRRAPERRSTTKMYSDQQNAHLQSRMTQNLPGNNRNKTKIPGTQILKL